MQAFFARLRTRSAWLSRPAPHLMLCRLALPDAPFHLSAIHTQKAPPEGERFFTNTLKLLKLKNSSFLLA